MGFRSIYCLVLGRESKFKLYYQLQDRWFSPWSRNGKPVSDILFWRNNETKTMDG